MDYADMTDSIRKISREAINNGIELAALHCQQNSELKGKQLAAALKDWVGKRRAAPPEAEPPLLDSMKLSDSDACRAGCVFKAPHTVCSVRIFPEMVSSAQEMKEKFEREREASGL